MQLSWGGLRCCACAFTETQQIDLRGLKGSDAQREDWIWGMMPYRAWRTMISYELIWMRHASQMHKEMRRIYESVLPLCDKCWIWAVAPCLFMNSSVVFALYLTLLQINVRLLLGHWVIKQEWSSCAWWGIAPSSSSSSFTNAIVKYSEWIITLWITTYKCFLLLLYASESSNVVYQWCPKTRASHLWFHNTLQSTTHLSTTHSITPFFPKRTKK
jgi:hypothetical protein